MGIATPTMANSGKSPELDELLKGQQFCLLTTFRKDGTQVGTPMWFASEDKTIYMSTTGGSVKVKRMRREPRLKLGPCDSGGRATGPQVEAQGRVLDPESDEGQRGERLLAQRYGLKRRLLMWGLRFAKDKSRAILAVTPL